MTIREVLAIIADEARLADERAENACKRSKYSVQDYHMCVEFSLQQLHDRIARESGLDVRCEIFPFRARLSAFRRDLINVANDAQLSFAVEQSKGADDA